MATIARLCGRHQMSKLFDAEKSIILLARAVSIKPQKAVPPCDDTYDERNTKLGRPYSPHLTIYAPQLTSLTSVTHRATGMLLSGFGMVLGIGALLPNDGLICLIDFVHDTTPLLVLVKFGLAFPFAYHLCNGVRHLIWDTGKFLTIKGVYTTGYVMLLAAAALGGFLAIV